MDLVLSFLILSALFIELCLHILKVKTFALHLLKLLLVDRHMVGNLSNHSAFRSLVSESAAVWTDKATYVWLCNLGFFYAKLVSQLLCNLAQLLLDGAQFSLDLSHFFFWVLTLVLATKSLQFVAHIRYLSVSVVKVLTITD